MGCTVLDVGQSEWVQVAGRLFWIEFEQIDGEVDVVGTQHQPVGLEVDIAKLEVRAMPHRIQVHLVGPVGHERSVVAIEQRDGIRRHQRLHGQGVGR